MQPLAKKKWMTAPDRATTRRNAYARPRQIENSGGHFYENCWCRPKIERVDGGGTLTIHNYGGH